jgi:hypothetical protein
MCNLLVLCVLPLKVHLFHDNSALHRNGCSIIFLQVWTAINLKPMAVCTCSYIQITGLKEYLGANSMAYLKSKLTKKLHSFCKLAKNRDL